MAKRPEWDRGARGRRPEQDVFTASVPDAQDTNRRTLKRARRVIGAALAQREVDPELLAAAELVAEAGGRR